MKKKNIIKIFAVTVLAVILITSLSSCGNDLSGKYTQWNFFSDDTIEIEFKSGNTIVYTEKDENKDIICTYKGKYELDGDKIIIDIDEKCKLNGEHAFERDKGMEFGISYDFIEIGEYTFEK